jgi:UPF0755 protein
MLSRRARNTALVLTITAALSCLLLTVAIVGFIAFSRQPNNNGINPFESFAILLQLRLSDTELRQSANPNSTPQPVCFDISSGASAGTVSQALAQQGLIRNAELFRNYLRYYGIDARLQVGTYALDPTMSMVDIAGVLDNPQGDRIPFTIIEGWRIEQVADRIDATSGFIRLRGADFLQRTGVGAETFSPTVGDFMTRYNIPAGKTLEGFLFPATYSFRRCTTADEFVRTILAAFDAQTDDNWWADARRANNLNPYEVVTLASIVEREAVLSSERTTIASVYLNRFNNARQPTPNPNIPVTLDADPTIQYALGNTRDPNTWWARITAEDYRGVISPYNTYLNRGLPPSPIASPRADSIRAVVYPEQTTYIYFRAACNGDGSHRFAETFQEQLANAC